jgi:hypothetical protein
MRLPPVSLGPPGRLPVDLTRRDIIKKNIKNDTLVPDTGTVTFFPVLIFQLVPGNAPE